MKLFHENYPDVLTERESRLFWSKVSKDGPTSDLVDGSCWIWNASQDKRGYGRLTIRGKGAISHKLSYILTNGLLEEDLELDHLCRNHSCVNPSHLEPVTHKVNVERGLSGKFQLSKTHCLRNHLLEEPNLRKDQLKKGKRSCLACRRADSKYRNAKRRHGTVLDPELFQQVSDEYYNEIIKDYDGI